VSRRPHVTWVSRAVLKLHVATWGFLPTTSATTEPSGDNRGDASVGLGASGTDTTAPERSTHTSDRAAVAVAGM
jgi:hypothetical protein